MGTLGWIITAVGTLGAGGFLAALYFAPQAAVAIERIALDLLSRILSTRIGVGALVGTLCLIGGYFYGDNEGAARVQTEWDAAEHTAIERGNDAHEQSEKEIPPVAESESVPAPTAPVRHFRFFNLKKAADACPPTPVCPAAPRRSVDRMLRSDPFNRDHN